MWPHRVTRRSGCDPGCSDRDTVDRSQDPHNATNRELLRGCRCASGAELRRRGDAAAGAGIQLGDMITKVNGRLIDSGDGLIAPIRSHAPGSQATLTVKTAAEATRQVQITLGTQQATTS